MRDSALGIALSALSAVLLACVMGWGLFPQLPLAALVLQALSIVAGIVAAAVLLSLLQRAGQRGRR